MKVLIGVVFLIGGLVLALALPDTEFLWFRGRPLGVVLAIVGVLDLAEAGWNQSKRAVPGRSS
ncbi:hypothetical protein [Luteipulveratus mongoliensis]|uniref:Uncharacterized protein n=1 Tax=Luteipulveratus mongoliensis TaxID=571913 RepID=A0A0K1JPX5_9MICO|nr:hypothetical protein [Luteipulveratus mongoliensis]AKU18625.1 hypothetical protein VV02_04085 [Luteipulveratus mongoliensis]